MKDIFGYCQSLLYQFLCLHSQSHNDDLSYCQDGEHIIRNCVETEHKFKNRKARLAIILMFTEIYLKGSLNHATANLHDLHSVLGGLKYGAKWF